MRKLIFATAVMVLLVVIAIGTFTSKEYEATQLMTLKEKYSKKHIPSVDHTKFAALQKKFSSPQEATATCISCHNKRHIEVMQSSHWNWEREEYIEGRGIVYLGKKNAINNFCIGTQGNETSCAKCHIGYAMDSKGKAYTDSTNVDCLVCHDNTETYVKAPEKGGAPLATLDLSNIAQNVGKPKRSNCGVCHFYGGGGNNVKHGDLEMAMFEPTKELDIHMGTDGTNMSCVDCHTTEKHDISGKVYSLSSMSHDRNTCEQCHTSNPHEDNILNEHTLKVACQSCHIPTYAKANATEMDWDWSTAGRLKDGMPYVEDDSMGNPTYKSIKGSFTWEKNVKPDYVWFNGKASHHLIDDQIQDTSKILVLNRLQGSYADEESKIVPVKIHKAKQPFDPVHGLLIQPKLYAEKKGEGAFWLDFDWQKAAEVGSKEANLHYCGEISFIETKMYWPVNHMVASKENTVACSECHTRSESRLAALTDFYMPGRDYSKPVEFAGKWLILLTLLGVFTHGTVRIIIRKNKSKGETK